MTTWKPDELDFKNQVEMDRSREVDSQREKRNKKIQPESLAVNLLYVIIVKLQFFENKNAPPYCIIKYLAPF